ncbi:MAG: DNA polymerase III subunit alpha [Gemmatimonadaceae bacterium]
MTGYIELHCHSAFSLLDGASHPAALVERAATLGYPALALTDHDDLGGVVAFDESARERGIGAIIGAEVRVDDNTLVLLAESRQGYGNLSTLITRARMDNPRGEPSVSLDTLARHATGLFALTGGIRGWVPSLVAAGDSDSACEATAVLIDIFDRRVAIECWDHGLPEEHEIVSGLIPIARALDIPWVVTNDVHYAHPEDRVVHDVLSCLRHKKTLDEMGTHLRPNGEWYLKSAGQMRRRWQSHPEGIGATLSIAERCAFRLCEVKPTIPAFPLPPGVSADEYLARLVEQGAHERWGIKSRAGARLRAGGVGSRESGQIAHELEIICRLGLAGYLLIVWDIVRFARRAGVLCQGRGSAANSAVCFCLGITAVDPIKLELLFERFLSEDRQGAPDIDIDFAHRDREIVLQYVYERYGRQHAAMVCEQICYRGKSAVRDTARVMGFSVEQANELARGVWEVGTGENDLGTADWTGTHLRAEKGEAGDTDSSGDAGLDPSDKRVRLIPAIVRGLRHIPRHRSIHVGGFVLTEEPLATVVPIEPASMADRTVVQWDKDDVEAAGLVKIDLLGLGMLTLIQDCLKYIRETRGHTIDLADLDFTDQAVYDDLSAADTIGVFQVESRAQMNTLPRLKPRCFYDLVVEVAIIRPGPIQGDMVHPYLRRRAGEEPVTYPHPSLEPILKRTLGIPLFQEQGMQVAITAAGFTPGEADTLRRAMGHKRSRERMAAICEKLVQGMARNGIPEDTAKRIYQQINAFADYGFPESHAASFALLVYASAYLRHYYAPEFTAAILNAQPMGFYSPGTLIEDARRHGVEVRPVDVTRSAYDSTLEIGNRESGVGSRESEMLLTRNSNRLQPGAHRLPTPDSRLPTPAVRLGLRLVHGLGSKAKERLEKTLAEDGPFRSIGDVVTRSGLDRRSLRFLAEAGALDSLVPDEPNLRRRRAALWRMLKDFRGDAGPLAPSRVTLDVPAHVPTMTPLEITASDYRMTGVSLNGHPMKHLREILSPNGIKTARDVLGMRDGERNVAVAGLVICRQRPGTAKGFVFLTLEDETGMVNVVVTPKRFERQALLISSAPLLLVRGTLQVEQRVVNLRGEVFHQLHADVGAEGTRSHDFH